MTQREDGAPDDAATARVICDAFHENVFERTGFLAPWVPVDDLPPVFDRYVEAAERVPDMVDASMGHQARPVLDAELGQVDSRILDAIDELDEPHDWRAMTVFTFLGHAYRWNTIPPTVEERERKLLALPDGIRRPWRKLADKLGMIPTSGFWNGFCHNWRLAGKRGGEPYDQSELTIDTMSIVHLWLHPPYREHCERFFSSFLLTEARGTEIAKALVDAIAAASLGDERGVLRGLERVQSAQAQIFREFSAVVRRSLVRVDIWMDYIQPFLGWGIAEPGEELHFGGSGIHIVTFEVLNVAFGLENESFLGRMAVKNRVYMLPRHRRFLAALDQGKTLLRRFVERSGNLELREAFNECVERLYRWRMLHQKRGAMYLRGVYEDSEFVHAMSTGGSVDVGTRRPSLYEEQMEERMQETLAAKLVPQ